MDILFGVQILNLLLVGLGISIAVLFVIVLLKLNKALSIWLENNKKN